MTDAKEILATRHFFPTIQKLGAKGIKYWAFMGSNVSFSRDAIQMSLQKVDF